MLALHNDSTEGLARRWGCWMFSLSISQVEIMRKKVVWSSWIENVHSSPCPDGCLWLSVCLCVYVCVRVFVYALAYAVSWIIQVNSPLWEVTTAAPEGISARDKVLNNELMALFVYVWSSLNISKTKQTGAPHLHFETVSGSCRMCGLLAACWPIG